MIDNWMNEFFGTIYGSKLNENELSICTDDVLAVKSCKYR